MLCVGLDMSHPVPVVVTPMTITVAVLTGGPWRPSRPGKPGCPGWPSVPLQPSTPGKPGSPPAPGWPCGKKTVIMSYDCRLLKVTSVAFHTKLRILQYIKVICLELYASFTKPDQNDLSFRISAFNSTLCDYILWVKNINIFLYILHFCL